MGGKKSLDRILIFDDGDRICFFDTYIYEVGYPVCFPINGKDTVYIIDSIAKSNSELKTYYAREI